jgi:septum formation protein
MNVLSSARPLLLASGSPRRREIVASLGVPFVVRAPEVDESTREGEGAAAYLERVVSAKLAAATASIAPDEAFGAVLVADTSVIVDGEILGKPRSDEEARAMITRLAGRTHEVSTRFAIGAPPQAAPAIASPLHEETVTTLVTFRALTPPRALAYVATGEGRDKAGAYAVQGRGAALVSEIRGSYSNVVGLPACELATALERLGLVP